MTNLAFAVLLFAIALPAFAQNVAERRAEVDKRSNEVLQRLYKAKPGAKDAVSKAYGYAVFTNLGINLVFISAAGGNGLARVNKGGKTTYMKMASAGIGLGLGVKDFRGIFVFDNQQVFDKFVNSGWEAGAHADAVAKAGKEGGALEGAVTVAPGVRLYQLTENGLALEATIQGTKYFKDDELNK
jgi:lipid-binding SYLF domain-containing protein